MNELKANEGGERHRVDSYFQPLGSGKPARIWIIRTFSLSRFLNSALQVNSKAFYGILLGINIVPDSY